MGLNFARLLRQSDLVIERRAPSAEAMTAPRPRKQRRAPSSSDRWPPRRGGGSSPSPCTYASAAGRVAGPVRPRVARHSLIGSARALAAAALLALSGALALPATAQAQSVTTLVSNIGQGSTLTRESSTRGAQRFTTGPHATGYTLSSVDVVSADAEGTSFEAKVCTVDGGGHPTSTCTNLAGPASFAAGTIIFTAPANTVLAPATTYTVVLTPDSELGTTVNYGLTTADGEDAGQADGWGIADTQETWGTSLNPPDWVTSGSGRSFRIAIKGSEAPPPEVTLHLSDNEAFEDLLAVTVTATASPASPVAFTVEISASPVAAATDDDFELSTNRTLSFAANATGSTGTVRISPVSDEDPEPNDVVTVSGVVSNPAIPNPDDVTLTILNDDADLPQDIAIDAPAAVDEGAGTANVTVTLTTLQNIAPVIDAQLFYRTRPGTATHRDDYTRPQGLGNRIAIVPVSEFSANADGTAWVGRHSFEIGIVDDGEAERDETIVFEIYSISDNPGIEQTIVIRDDETPPAVSIAAANPTVLEDQPAVFTLSRTGATGSALTVTVALTEQADRDVLPDGAATERTATFARGSSTAALTVELKNDRLAEPDRDLTAAVRAGAGYTVGDPSTATVTVEDDDAPTPPVIEDIEVVSTPRLWSRGAREPDTYGEGENIRIGVRFDQPVHVEGYPVLALEVGDPCISVCEARYESGSGTDTLVFAYLVLDTEIDRNGVAIPANPIGESIDEFDGFSIRNDWDQEARLSYRREGTKSGHKADGTRQAAQHLSVEDAEAHEADGEMTFTVRLEPRGLGIVTVDYRTRDGSGDTGAKAGEDYTETRGTLRFNPLETERTVTVPIIDDDEEDDGETFTLRLSNPDGARLRDGDRAARGTIRNSDPKALSASFPTSAFASASHSGADDRPQAVVAFSEPVAAFAADTPSVSVTGGRVASVQPHAEDGLENAWVFFLVADGDGDVTLALVADAACAAGGICTPGGTALAEVPAAATIPGPGGPAEPEGPPLTASFEGAPAEHDGERAFTFRIAFSERVGWMNGRRLREDVVAVSGGRATSAGRVDRRRDLWELTVEPDSPADVTVTLATGAACRTPAAVCTSDGRALSETISTTVAGPPDEPLTASFEGVPAAHDGETAFTLRLAFSEPLSWMNGRRLREDVVAVAGGRATSASRVNRRRDLWQLTVELDSLADVTVTLAAGAACRTPAAVCTSDGRALSNTLSTTVRGPVAVSVADARAEEGTDESIDFAVTLSRAASGTVAVAYATADGSATAGADYTARKGQLTFAPGETEKTVRVPMLDDAIDEGAETFTLRLTNAAGAVIADGTATGTLENADPLQKMWLARFGRTVAGQVTDVIGARLTGSAGGGSHVTIGGRRLSLGGGSKDSEDTAARTDRDDRLGGAGGAAADMGPWGGLMDEGHGADGALSLTPRELLLGSAFQLSLGAAEDDGVAGPAMRWRAWGRVTGTGFNGTDENRGVPVTLDGHVVTGALGVDAEWARWLAGVAVSHSIGDGSFGLSGHADAGGELESTLTGVYPYARYALNERLSLWGVLGHAWGDLTLSEDRTGTSIETDTILRMGAVGARGVLLPAPTTGGFELAVRTDALLVQMTSDAVTGGADSGGNLAAAAADTSRLRLMVEGSQTFALAWGGVMTPSLEVGLRHDGGDAETGTGVEVGGGLRYADPARGLTVEARARVLVAHEDGGYEEWGASGAVRLDPGASGRGLFLTLSPTYGAAASGVEGLWSRQDTAGLAAGDAFEAGRRLDAELGYGLGAFGGSGVATPYAGLGLSDGGQTWRMGTRWTLGTDFELGVEGTRRRVANGEAPEHGLMLRGSLRW